MKKLFLALSLALTALTAHAVDVTISQLPLGIGTSTGSNDSFPYVDATADVTRRLKLYDIANIPTFSSRYAPLASPVFTGSVSSPSFVGPLTGNASTATAFSLVPTGCGTNQYAVSIAANGNLTCATVTDSALGGGYLKADGTRALTANWNAGAYSLTANSVVIGSAVNQISGVASFINGSGTLTLPTSTDTLVGRATTDTLTGKSLSGSTNTFSSIPDSALNTITTAGKVSGNTITSGTISGSTALNTTGTINSGAHTATSFSGPLTGNVTGNLTGNVVGNVTGNVTGNASGSAASFTGNLTGDVTSTGMATTVATVGGSSAAAVHSAEVLANAATNAKTNNAIVKRDGSGAALLDVTGNVTGNVSGTAATFTGSLSGDVSSTGMTTSIGTGKVTAAMLAGSIPDADLNTISTAGKVANSATTAASANTASAIVARDGSGNFTAGTVTANLTGNVTGNTSGTHTGAVVGNASTSTAFAATPSGCGSNSFATGIAANGNLTCTGVADAALTSSYLKADGSRALTSGWSAGQTITAPSFVGPLTGNASTATAFAATPTGCSAGQYASGIAANGNLTCATPPGGSATYTVVTGQAINLGDAIYISVGAADGSRTSGLAYQLDATNSKRIEFAGISTGAYASGATATVQVAGLVTGLSGLTLGAPVFASVSTPGAFQTTAPTTVGQYIIQLGTAASTTSLVANGAGSATAVQITIPGGGAYNPTVTKYTSGSGTYTTPSNVIYIKVRMVGGGGGGSSSGTAGGNNGTAGGTTTFGSSLLSAGGGNPGQWATAPGTGGSVSLGSITTATGLTGGTGGGVAYANTITNTDPISGAGGNNPFGGAGGSVSVGNAGVAGAANTGAGGSGGGAVANQANNYSGAGGGAGGFIDAIINSPASSYSYAVGAAGSGGGTSGASNAQPGGAGGTGYIEITEFYAPGVIGTATNVTGTVAVANGGTGATTIAGLASQFTVPTIQNLSGSGTFTTPANATWMRVIISGPGGGGGGSGSASGGSGSAGSGNAQFGSTTCGSGGGGAGGGYSAGAGGGSCTVSTGTAVVAVTGGGGGPAHAYASSYPAGTWGGSNPLGGAPQAASANSAGNAAATGTGAGGGGASGVSNGYGGAGGGAGGYAEVIVVPTALQTFSYVVPSGGAGGTAGTSGAVGGAGGSGRVTVEVHYN